MKFQSLFFITLLSFMTFSCTDDITNMGVQIQPEGDKIIVEAVSINLTSENFIVPYMYSKPDSFLLGAFSDNTYGSTYADILTQIQPPLDWSYPEGSVADSAKLILYYYSWFGDAYSPIQVNIYEMNKGKTFDYAAKYTTNIDINEYCDKSIKIGSRIFSAKDKVVIRPDPTVIVFPLDSDFVRRFSSVLNIKYTENTEETSPNHVNRFHEFFNGMYITTDFGAANMLYLRGIIMRYYFSYKYLAEGETDSTTVNVHTDYPSNKEVRLINRVQHPDTAAIKAKIDATPDVNYISSPANIYSKITIPLKNIKDSLDVGNKKLLINRAVLRIDATNVKNTTLEQPLPKSLLLIKESAYNEFFSSRHIPLDTCAITATYSAKIDEDTNEVSYYYSFDLAPLITNELNKTNNFSNSMTFILLPVSLTYDGAKNIIEARQQNLISGLQICSGSNPDKPMKINIVYSGF